MKKKLALVLSLVLCCAMLSGCTTLTALMGTALRPYGTHGAHARRRRGNTHENGHKEICRSDKGSYSR